MKRLAKLFLRFKKKDREESDCSIVSEITDEYYVGDKKKRNCVVRWAFKQIKNPDTVSLVRNLLLNFLHLNRHDLTKERQSEFREFVRSSKEARKHIKSFKK